MFNEKMYWANSTKSVENVSADFTQCLYMNICEYIIAITYHNKIWRPNCIIGLMCFSEKL